MFRQWFRRGKGRNEAAGGQARGDRRSHNRADRAWRAAEGEFPVRELSGHRGDSRYGAAGRLRRAGFALTGPSRGAPAVRHDLAIGLAELTARLHDAGFVHTDFTRVICWCGSTSRSAAPGDDRPRRPEGAARIGWREARANLALLNHYFWLRERPNRPPALRDRVSPRRRVDPPDPHAFARGIEVATRAWAERLWRRWGRRCRSTNKYFKTFWNRTAWAVAARRVDRNTMRELLVDPDAPFSWPDTVLLKDSRTTTVAEVTLPVTCEPTRVIYKRFNRKKWLDPFLCVFRPSRAWRSAGRRGKTWPAGPWPRLGTSRSSAA